MTSSPVIDTERLAQIARRIRTRVIQVIQAVGGGHVGGSLSAADMLAVLYFHQLKIDPANPGWPERDRFILSKGHCSLALYAALAERGCFPADELRTYAVLGSRLQAHPDMRKTPGVDMSSGSLGQGLSAGIGMALAARHHRMAYRTFVMLGDGESEEGQVWEAAMWAGARRLDNLTAILDYNKLSQTGSTENLLAGESLARRWRDLGWDVREIDGHDLNAIVTALATPGEGGPCLVLAHTIKGRGVSFMEGRPEFHSATLSKEQAEAALAELGVTL